MAKLAQSKTVLALEALVLIVLAGIITYGPEVAAELFSIDIGAATAVTVMIGYLVYEFASPEGKAVFDEWKGKFKRDDRAETGTIMIVVLIIAGILLAGVLAVYYFKVDVLAAAFAGVALIAGLVGYNLKKPSTEQPVQVVEVKPAIIGVSTMQVWDGFRYVENAIIDWQQWLEAYGWNSVKIGTVPAGLATVQFSDGRSPSGLFYDKDANLVYATTDCPLFTKKTTEQLYGELLASANPAQWLVDTYGKAAKDQIADGYTDGDGWYWQAVENAIKSGDKKQAVDVFCKLTGWTVPGPK